MEIAMASKKVIEGLKAAHSLASQALREASNASNRAWDALRKAEELPKLRKLVGTFWRVEVGESGINFQPNPHRKAYVYFRDRAKTT
jgi:hypothetical protein